MAELLNIEHNVKRLIIKALNKYQRTKDAAMALGISSRTLTQKRWQYNIVKEYGVWFEKV